MRTISDTLDDHFDSATVTVYYAPNGGFVSGNSGYHESAKGQEFPVDSVAFTVEGFLYWFAYKEQQSTNADSSSLTLTFWKMDSSATISSIERLVPRTVFASSPLYIQDMDTSVNFTTGVNVWMISPVIVYNNFMAGFSMENLHIKDTIALYSSTDGDAPIPTISWEKWNGIWNPIYYAWGLDIDFAIFPLVDKSTAGIEDNYFFQHLKMSLFPNPASDMVRVSFETEKSGEVDFILFDQTGKVVKQVVQGQLSKGQYQAEIDLSDLPAGMYFLSMGLDQSKRLTKKLLIR